ncbi:MAG: hypothetical protein OZ921_11945 [Sorangiineae bacterium]|nr:hypothetical protein [Polyangiaceae bacterium]MEB2323217.1 hypothetical protein [Sorangiineae bacterium]
MGTAPSLARAAALLCAVAIVLISGRASAAAPMCGEQAISVAAPPPVRPIDPSRASRCVDGAAHDVTLTTPPVEHPPLTAPAWAPDRILPWGTRGLACPRSTRLAMRPFEAGPERPGHRTSVFRPPRDA